MARRELPEQLQFMANRRAVQRTTDASMKGKLCVVAGSTSGVGLQAVRRFARAGADVVMVCRDRAKAKPIRDDLARAHGVRADIVIADTAGRLHTKSNLMEELAKVRRVIDKRLPGAFVETFFVLDATTGQNGLAQAKAFHAAVGLTGVILTKLDSTAKGGIVFSIEKELGVPVRFVGVGEQADDLLPFDPQGFVAALFDQA